MSIIYKATGNLRAVQILLGHARIESTVRYLGVDVENVALGSGQCGALLCCALPALLVTLGMGAAMAGLVSAVPELVWLSERKPWVFGISGAMILGSAVLHRRARNLPCPVDPAQARACARLRRLSGITLGVAAVAWVVGFFFAFLAVPLFYE